MGGVREAGGGGAGGCVIKRLGVEQLHICELHHPTPHYPSQTDSDYESSGIKCFRSLYAMQRCACETTGYVVPLSVEI